LQFLFYKLLNYDWMCPLLERRFFFFRYLNTVCAHIYNCSLRWHRRVNSTKILTQIVIASTVIVLRLVIALRPTVWATKLDLTLPINSTFTLYVVCQKKQSKSTGSKAAQKWYWPQVNLTNILWAPFEPLYLRWSFWHMA